MRVDFNEELQILLTESKLVIQDALEEKIKLEANLYNASQSIEDSDSEEREQLQQQIIQEGEADDLRDSESIDLNQNRPDIFRDALPSAMKKVNSQKTKQDTKLHSERV